MNDRISSIIVAVVLLSRIVEGQPVTNIGVCKGGQVKFDCPIALGQGCCVPVYDQWGMIDDGRIKKDGDCAFNAIVSDCQLDACHIRCSSVCNTEATRGTCTSTNIEIDSNNPDDGGTPTTGDGTGDGTTGDGTTGDGTTGDETGDGTGDATGDGTTGDGTGATDGSGNGGNGGNGGNRGDDSCNPETAWSIAKCYKEIQSQCTCDLGNANAVRRCARRIMRTPCGLCKRDRIRLRRRWKMYCIKENGGTIAERDSTGEAGGGGGRTTRTPGSGGNGGGRGGGRGVGRTDDCNPDTAWGLGKCYSEIQSNCTCELGNANVIRRCARQIMRVPCGLCKPDRIRLRRRWRNYCIEQNGGTIRYTGPKSVPETRRALL